MSASRRDASKSTATARGRQISLRPSAMGEGSVSHIVILSDVVWTTSPLRMTRPMIRRDSARYRAITLYDATATHTAAMQSTVTDNARSTGSATVRSIEVRSADLYIITTTL